jgi:hypothetical protein
VSDRNVEIKQGLRPRFKGVHHRLQLRPLLLLWQRHHHLRQPRRQLRLQQLHLLLLRED